ncbi:hypothetical protein [Streptomyces aurantiacus]|nr:hypothetical protein [Streptomyces aurantiacus]
MLDQADLDRIGVRQWYPDRAGHGLPRVEPGKKPGPGALRVA